jgi:hypothetical protein
MVMATPTWANDAADIDSTTKANNNADNGVRLQLVCMWFLWPIIPR